MTPKSFPAAAVPSSARRPRRVLIVDDHPLTRSAVRYLLEREAPHIEVVGIAGDGGAAISMARNTLPDIVLLDLDLGDQCGLDLIPAIGGPGGAAIIVLTASDSPRERSRALYAGAVDFVSKLSPASVLLSAIFAAPVTAGQPGDLSPRPGTALPAKQVEGSAGAAEAKD